MPDDHGRPLRRILLYSSHGRHLLECRHELPLRFTAYGPTTPKSHARCDKCGRGEPADFTVDQVDELLEAAGVLAENRAAISVIACARGRRPRPADTRQGELFRGRDRGR